MAPARSSSEARPGPPCSGPSGASQLRLADLALDAADVELSGASDAVIRVKDLLKYDVNSASHLEYLGEPDDQAGASKTGVSSVSHRR